MVRLSDDPRLNSWIRLWAVILAGCCAAMIVVVIGTLWVLNDFHGIGLDATTTTALLLGTVGATALGVALMGLVFYSDASRADERATGFEDQHAPPRPERPTMPAEQGDRHSGRGSS